MNPQTGKNSDFIRNKWSFEDQKKPKDCEFIEDVKTNENFCKKIKDLSGNLGFILFNKFIDSGF